MTFLREQVRLQLRKQLKEKKLGHAQVAAELGISLATLKRWLARGDMPFSAIVGIAEMLQLSLADLEKLLDRSASRRPGLSAKQEKFLATNPRTAYLFLLLFLGIDEAEIQRRTRITQAELEAHLRKLIAADLVYVSRRGAHLALVRGPFRLQKNGAFTKAVADRTLGVLRARLGEWPHAIGPLDESQSVPYLRTFELYLSRRNATLLAHEFSRVLESFQDRSRLDREVTDPKDLVPVSGLASVAIYDLWRAVLWEGGK